MKNFTFSSDLISATDDLNILLSIIILVNNKKKLNIRDQAKNLNRNALSSNKILRAPSQPKLSRGLCVLPELKSTSIMFPHIEDEIKLRPSRFISTSMSLNLAEEREYSLDIIFKELVPTTILEKIGTQVTNYTSHEQLHKKKENFILQKNYNRLKEEIRKKSQHLDALQTRVANNMDKLKEHEDVKNKAVFVETQIESVFDKCCVAEDEAKILQKILACCIKNPTRNDE